MNLKSEEKSHFQPHLQRSPLEKMSPYFISNFHIYFNLRLFFFNLSLFPINILFFPPLPLRILFFPFYPPFSIFPLSSLYLSFIFPLSFFFFLFFIFLLSFPFLYLFSLFPTPTTLKNCPFSRPVFHGGSDGPVRAIPFDVFLKSLVAYSIFYYGAHVKSHERCRITSNARRGEHPEPPQVSRQDPKPRFHSRYGAIQGCSLEGCQKCFD